MGATLTARDNKLRAILRDHPHWVLTAEEARARVRSPVVERPAEAGLDAFGVRWSLEPGAQGGTYPAAGGQVIADLCHWEGALRLPDLDACDWDAVAREARLIDRAACLIEGFVEMGLFERSCLLLGMEEALMAYLTQPREMGRLLTVLADYKTALIQRLDEAADLDLIWYGDDWGGQSGLLLPPQVWRSLVKPQTQRVYDCMKARGILINQHSCGRIEVLVPDLVEMGATMWNPCQPCNDLADLKRRHGRHISFCGGIDSQFVLGRPGATEQEVRAEVRRRINELATGGGYIAAPSHAIASDPGLLAAMDDEIRSYGRRWPW